MPENSHARSEWHRAYRCRSEGRPGQMDLHARRSLLDRLVKLSPFVRTIERDAPDQGFILHFYRIDGVAISLQKFGDLGRRRVDVEQRLELEMAQFGKKKIEIFLTRALPDRPEQLKMMQPD